MKTKIFKINFELLEKVFEKGGMCLCSLDRMCVCRKFLEEEICDCGVFKKI